MPDSTDYLSSTLLALPDEERAALERSLVGTARAAALGELTADIGHDLANPLFAVIGLVELLLMDAVPGSPAHERLLLIRRTGLELKDGLRAVLDFARPADGAPPAALDAAARLAVQLVRHGRAKELEVSERYPGEPLLVSCGPGLVTQAALHVVAAARTCAGDTGRVDVEVSSEGEAAVLRVSPAGQGGLALVAAGRIAVDHGGSLGHDGTAVVLRLPLWAEP
jgi:two-component system, sporulation sensor kinase E